MTKQVLIELQDAQGQSQQYTLGPGQYYLGKADSCAIVLNDPHVSRHHATLEVSDNELIFEDNKSTNGTWFENERLQNPIALQPGDVLQMGTMVLSIISIDGKKASSAPKAPVAPKHPMPAPQTGSQGNSGQKQADVEHSVRSQKSVQPAQTTQTAPSAQPAGAEPVTFGKDAPGTAGRANFSSQTGGIPYVPGAPIGNDQNKTPERAADPSESLAVKVGAERVSKHVSHADTTDKETHLTPDQQAEMARYFAQMSDQPMSQPNQAEEKGTKAEQEQPSHPEGQSQLDPQVARARIENAIRIANPALFDAMSPEDRDMYIKQVTGVAQVMVTEQLKRLEKKVHEAKQQHAQGVSGQPQPKRRLSIQTLSTISFGELKPLLEDISVSEVIINGLNAVQIIRHGRLEQVQYRFPDFQSIYQLIFKMVGPLGYTPETLPPVLKTPLTHGTHLSLIMPPVAAQGPQISLKKTRKIEFRKEHLMQFGSCSAAMLQFLSQCLTQHRNMIITGAIGSGKSVCLNALANMSQPHERIAVIERSPELTVALPQAMSLQTAMPELQGYVDVTLSSLIDTAIGLGPDRMVIGDIDSQTALDAITTMRCNDFGVLSCAKAHSAQDMINQLELNILLHKPQLPISVVREQIAQAVNIVIVVDKVYDGTHKITQIAEVFGLEDGMVGVHSVFEFLPKSVSPEGLIQGKFEPTGYVPEFYKQLAQAGAEVDTKIFTPSGD